MKLPATLLLLSISGALLAGCGGSSSGGSGSSTTTVGAAETVAVGTGPSPSPTSTAPAAQIGFTGATATQSWSLSSDVPMAQAVQIVNSGTQTSQFQLGHNGEPIFLSIADLKAHIQAQADAFTNEPLARKGWRYLHANVSHLPPISEDNWAYSALVTVNSVGFGECGQYATALVETLLAANQTARVMGLTGHIVPEVYDGLDWHMYDPDLGVYYYDRTGQVASVATLSADTDLILNPIQPVLPNDGTQEAYSTVISAIYGDGEHYDATWTFLYQGAALSPRITLPPGASFTYPGKFLPQVIGYNVSGTTLIPNVSEYAAEAKLDLPSGWTGTLNQLPLVLWDVQGSGTVTLNGVSYSAGSAELTSVLQQYSNSQLYTSITVNQSSGVSLIFLINWYRFAITPTMTVTAYGNETSGLNATVVTLDSAYWLGPRPQ